MQEVTWWVAFPSDKCDTCYSITALSIDLFCCQQVDFGDAHEGFCQKKWFCSQVEIDLNEFRKLRNWMNTPFPLKFQNKKKFTHKNARTGLLSVPALKDDPCQSIMFLTCTCCDQKTKDTIEKIPDVWLVSESSSKIQIPTLAPIQPKSWTQWLAGRCKFSPDAERSWQLPPVHSGQDSFPIFVKNQQPKYRKWQVDFNAWASVE